MFEKEQHFTSLAAFAAIVEKLKITYFILL